MLEKTLKNKIIANYIGLKPNSIVAEMIEKLGYDMTIRVLDAFQGRLMYLPRNSSLKRTTLPIVIKDELDDLEPGSKDFKSAVRQLADFYKTTQRAILKMNKTGVYTR